MFFGGDAILSLPLVVAGGRDADPFQGHSDRRAGDAAAGSPGADVPGGGGSQRKTPAEAGINPQLLKDAIDFALASEIRNPHDLKLDHYRTFGREPFGDAIGPIKDRGGLTGVIIHNEKALGRLFSNGFSFDGQCEVL
jgi:hypothetical protein